MDVTSKRYHLVLKGKYYLPIRYISSIDFYVNYGFQFEINICYQIIYVVLGSFTISNVEKTICRRNDVP